MKHLYFLAIVPTEPLLSSLQEEKERFSALYHTSHALKSPPHITLYKPFRWEDEQALISKLEEAVKDMPSFALNLKDYGAFAPRVIFVDVEGSEKLGMLKNAVEETMADALQVEKEHRPFAPHLTLAHKDLSPQNFKKAWHELKEKPFQASFEVEGFWLLKHNGRKWEMDRFINLSSFSH